MKANRKKIQYTILIVFLVIVAGLYVYLYLIPNISSSLAETYIVNYGSMKTSYDSKCIVVRDETCYFANASGTATYYIEESEKTRIGTRIADIYSGGNKEGMFCEKTGFISYYYDGYEDVLSSESVKSANPSTYMSITAKPAAKNIENTVKGDFMFKLVDGDTWYIMIPVDPAQLPLFRIGGDLSLVLADGTVLKANAERVVGSDSLAIMARILSYYPDFCKIRNLDVQVVIKQTDGLEIPSTAVVYENDNPGVYVLNTDGEYHFTRIEILEEQGGYCIISEDEFTVYQEDGSSRILSSVSLYDEILRDAAK